MSADGDSLAMSADGDPLAAHTEAQIKMQACCTLTNGMCPCYSPIYSSLSGHPVRWRSLLCKQRRDRTPLIPVLLLPTEESIRPQRLPTTGSLCVVELIEKPQTN